MSNTNHTLYNSAGRITRGLLLPLKGEIAATGSTPVIDIIGEFTNWDMTQLNGEFVTPETHRVIMARVPQPDGKSIRTTLVITKGEVEDAVASLSSPVVAVVEVTAPSTASAPLPADNSAAILAGVQSGTVRAEPDCNGKNYWCAKTGVLLAYDVTRNLYVGNSKDAWGGDPTMVGTTKKMVLTKDGENFA